ncbi:MAG: VIT1/CCC1 transporter family protein [Parcubacteria group bacterium]|nr:VIT1/CCC1 transporter family protein [Parcubacteria group bacterium]
MPTKELFASYVRNLIFGVEDGLVSTVGLLSGIAVAGVSQSGILLTGTILIFVEAFSMAVGSFLSERSSEEYTIGNNVSSRYAFTDGVIMFFSYFISGLIPLIPYVVFDARSALLVSVILSLIALFILGIVSAKIFRTHVLHSGLRTLIVGGSP